MHTSAYLTRPLRTEADARAQRATAAAIVRLAQSQRREEFARSVAVALVGLTLVSLLIVLPVVGMAHARQPRVVMCDCPSVSSTALPFKGTLE